MSTSVRRFLTRLTAAALVLGSGAALASPASADGGDWTRISTGTGGTTYQSSLHRTPDDVLHVLYPKSNDGGDTTTYGAAAIDPDGTLAGQHDVLVPGWSALDPTPALIGDGDGLRAVFGGVRDAGSGFWSDGRMYTATAPQDGVDWTLPPEAVGQSHSAHRSRGTAAVELADGTPVAAYARGSRIVWHVGTGDDPDQTLTIDGCCASALNMVDNAGTVWIAWHQNGRTRDTNGVFFKRILPEVGPTVKAPDSSVGAHSVPTRRVPLAVQFVNEDDGAPRVWVAYCTGYPTCDRVALAWVSDWATTHPRKVPCSRGATDIAMSTGPGFYNDRIWVAWSDRTGLVRTITTTAPGFTGLNTLGRPQGADATYGISMDAGDGVADVVVNTGRGFWHTQPALAVSVKATPRSWRHGTAQKVTFTGSADKHPKGIRVKVGRRTCTTDWRGRCSITFPRTMKPGVLVARATRSGYDAGTVRLRVT